MAKRSPGSPATATASLAEHLAEGFAALGVRRLFGVPGGGSSLDVIAAAAKEAGNDIAVAGFARYALGEGIEREKGDFAAEVAAAQAGS